MDSTNKRLYLVTLEVGEVPADFYREHGKREIAYTQAHINSGTIRELFITPNRRQSWLVVQVEDEQALNALIEGFPLRPYFRVSRHEVRDLAADVRNA